MTMMEDIANLRDQVIYLSVSFIMIMASKYQYFNFINKDNNILNSISTNFF